MRALDFGGVGQKGGEAGVGLIFSADSPETFAAEFREAKAALLAWKEKHGPACSMIMFTVTAPAEFREDVTQLLDKMYREEAELAPILQQLTVNVAILNAKGKPVCKYRLGHEEPRFKTVSDKPWWKFW